MSNMKNNKVTVNINGKDVEIELTEDQIKKIKSSNPMEEVYAFHNTTEEEFENKFKDISLHLKAYEQERMIVNFYNKGEEVNFNNTNQVKYYPWFYLDTFRLYRVYLNYDGSACSKRLCFLRREDATQAVERFFEIYKQSRTL